MRTEDLNSLTNSAMQAVLAEFRKNKIPEPWGEDYIVLRENLKNDIMSPMLDKHHANNTLNDSLCDRYVS